jgi:peptide/nickel transport system substrate-binding protein
MDSEMANSPQESEESGGLTRETFVKRGAAFAAGVGLAGAGVAPASAARIFGAAAPQRKLLHAIYTGANINDTLDPARAKSNVPYTVNGAVYEPLVAVNERWQWSGLLAESIKSNAAGDLWTFRLRKGVRFHNGKPLTAADVAYTIRRLLNPATGSDALAVLSGDLDPTGIQEAPGGDQSVVRFKLKAPNFNFPVRLATRYTQILPEGAVTPWGIGTGPFMVKSFNAGKSFELVRNPRYRNPSLPGLSGVTGVVVPDQATKVQAVLSGDAEFADPIEYASVDVVRQNSAVQLLRASYAIYYHVVLDTRTPPFDDNKVRMAIKRALNRPQMVSVVMRGYGQPAYDVSVPTNDPAFPPSLVAARKQDLALARQLLAAAGHPGGFSMKLYTSQVVAGLVDVAVLFAQQMAQIGITVDVQQTPPSTFISNYYAKVPAFTVWQFPRETSDMIALTLKAGASANVSHWSSPIVEKAIAQASQIRDPKKRNLLWRGAVAAIANGSGIVVPMAGDSLWLGTKRLHGMRFNNVYTADWSHASLS